MCIYIYIFAYLFFFIHLHIYIYIRIYIYTYSQIGLPIRPGCKHWILQRWPLLAEKYQSLALRAAGWNGGRFGDILLLKPCACVETRRVRELLVARGEVAWLANQVDVDLRTRTHTHTPRIYILKNGTLHSDFFAHILFIISDWHAQEPWMYELTSMAFPWNLMKEMDHANETNFWKHEKRTS